MATFTSLVLVILAFTLCKATSFQAIPALMWSPERSMSQLPQVKGVDPIKTDDFLKLYLSPVMDSSSQSAVVFLQDKLHVNHFTKYADVYSLESNGGAFKNIKSLMENHHSLELPQVDNPLDAVEKLKSSFSDVYTVNSTEDVEGLSFNKDGRVLIIVQLGSVKGQKDHENVIQQNDATVGAISRHLEKKNVRYSALFTGQSTAEEQVENAESFRKRHLLAADTYNGTFMNVSDGHIYVFLKEAYVRFKGPNRNVVFNLTVDANTANNSTFDNTTATIRYDFKDVLDPVFPGQSYEVSIVTEAQHTQDRWKITRTYLEINGGTTADGSNITLTNATLNPGDLDMQIPILYSWHCTNQTMLLDTLHYKENKDFNGTAITLTGYQLQPFNIQKDRFHDAQDCVPYFTTAIWMFLFCSIFLLSILIFGVLMVLSLSTMDKYDDPKGKTITVAQGND